MAIKNIYDTEISAPSFTWNGNTIATQAWVNANVGTPTLAAVTTAGDTTTNNLSVGSLNVTGGTIVSGVDTRTNAGIAIAKGDYLTSNDGSYIRNLIGLNSSSNIEIGQSGTSLISNIQFKPGSNGNIQFYASGSEDVRINSSGNVTIGTTNSYAKLSVYASSHNNGISVNRQADTTAALYIGNDGGNNPVLAANNADMLFGRDVGGAFTERMRLTNGGNVGIGTTSPAQKLDVNGVIAATGGNSSNWNTAYSWGDHAAAGYLTSYSETDTLASVTARGASTSTNTTFNGTLTANSGVYVPYAAGQHKPMVVLAGATTYGLFHTEATSDEFTFDFNGTQMYKFRQDGVFTINGNTITTGKVTNWDTAYNWGDHSAAGYLTSFDITTQTDPKYLRSDVDDTASGNLTLQDVDITNGKVLRLYRSGGAAHQRVDARLDGTDQARLHWYGRNDAQTNTGFKHAWYDGVSYINVTASNPGTVTFAAASPIIKIDGAQHAGLQIDRASTSYDANLMFQTAGATKFRLWLDAADALGIRDEANATEMVTFKSGGNVGIGTTSPSTALDVNGVITATGGNSGNWNTAYGWGDHASAGYLTSYSETDTLATVVARGAYFGTTNQGYVDSGGTYGTNLRKISRITLTHGGSNWNSDNHAILSKGLSGADDDSISINSYNGIHLRLDTNNNNANNTTNFTIHNNTTTSSNELFRVTGDGNVGIGTTAPGYKLDVDGDVQINETLIAKSGVDLVLQARSSQAVGINSNGTRTMTLDASNKVGIGTTAPDRNLHIYQGNSAITGYGLTGGIDIESTSISGINILSPNNGYGRIYFGSPSSNTSGAIEYIHNATLSSAYMKFRAGAADHMFILGNGNVGIGTTSPSGKLHIQTDASSEFIFTGASTSGYATTFHMDNTGLDIGHNSASRSLNLKTGSLDRLTITGGGNVGIGTTSPGYTLDVNGSMHSTNITIADAIYHEGDTNTVIGFGTDTINLSTGGGVRATINNSGAKFNNDVVVVGGATLSLGERGEPDDLGRTVLLEGAANAGSGEGAGRIFFSEHNSTTTSADNYGLSLYYEGDPNIALPSGFQPNQGNGTWSLRRHNNSVNGDYIMSGSRTNSDVTFWGNLTVPNIIYHQGDTNTYMQFPANDTWAVVTAASERLRVTSTGDVGIGTTSPSEKLEVSGNILASGDITAFSDARLKENVETLPNALESVKAMRGVTYNKTGEEKQSVGVIAQEVQAVLPQLVAEHKDGMLSVAYGNITAVLIEAIKEQQEQIDELKAIINGLTK